MLLTDRCLPTGGTVHGGDLEEAIGIDLERSNKLGLATEHGRNSGQFKLAKQAVITALCPFAFVSSLVNERISRTRRQIRNLHREGNSCLVILNGGEHS